MKKYSKKENIYKKTLTIEYFYNHIFHTTKIFSILKKRTIRQNLIQKESM